MRRRWICLAAAAGVLWSGGAGATAAVPRAAGATGTAPVGCRTVAFTATGGYYSGGLFFREPEDTVTLTAHWCFSGGLVTTWSTSFTTTIAAGLDPRISLSAVPARHGRVLDIGLSGNYAAGVINNVGTVGITGYVTASGRDRFTDTSGAGG